MLSGADIERMLAEDRRKRVGLEDRALAALGIVERNFNVNEPRDPHSGKWIDGPGSAIKAAGKVLGKMSEDKFFGAHGEDWSDQYGTPDTLSAILWADGTASLYRDLGKSKVHVFGDVSGADARGLASDVKWAAGQPDVGDPTGGKLAGARRSVLGAEVGYGYDGNRDLFVRVTMPPVGADRKPTAIDMVDLDQVDQLVADLNTLADDMAGQG